MANRERDSRREQSWRDVLRRFDASGLSVRDFCRHERLSVASLYAWRRTIRLRDAGTETHTQPPPTFLPVVVQRDALSPQGGGISLELRGGRRLHLPESTPVERLAALVQALERTEDHR